MNKQTIKNSAKETHILKEALAFLESKGKTSTIGALDVMPKTAQVAFINRINIGSGLITVIYSGEVAAARAAADAARNLSEKIGAHFVSNVIARPHSRIYELVTQESGEELEIGSKQALGMIETDGYAVMIEAADRGIKSADVAIPGWVTVGSGLTTVFFRGEVAAVQAAVEEGSIFADKLGKVIACHVIAQPHKGTEEAAPIGKYTDKSNFRDVNPDEALGILETRGITGLIEGIDAGLKAANIVVQGWEKIGRGITSTLFRGSVADVRTAMDASLKGASAAGEVVNSYIIARPHKELDKGK